MLTEVSCELFKVNGQVRQPIRFEKGLNIILGGKTGVNSIGKSTMLLIIDFAFAGDTYAKSDAVKQLGNHNIHFTFEFDEKPYYFIRHTATPGDIFQVDKNSNLIATIKRDDYTKWLSEHYHMNFAGVQFRNTISRFFRIYGKNNYNELRPLQMRGGTESQESAIHVLIALFNQYESVLAFEEQLKLAEEIRPSMAFSQEFLSAYTRLDRRIHKLEDENEAFDTRNTLQNEKKGASDRLKSQMVTVLKVIELTINRHMSEISDVVSQEKDNPPILGIKEYNSYSFETPKDTGTGTNFKGMLIYDLSILDSTALPALAHDSLLFANVSDETIEQILALYAREKQKQIFIAFDREGKYDVETQSIIKENTVLKLDTDEQALFGWKWSRKDAEK